MTEQKSPISNTEPMKVSIETHTSTIVGTVHPPAIAYRGRLSDLLNQKGAVFLNVTEATVYSPRDAEKPIYSSPYLAINLGSIEVVRPLDEE